MFLSLLYSCILIVYLFICFQSILQSLCDPDIGFITFEGGASVNEVVIYITSISDFNPL